MSMRQASPTESYAEARQALERRTGIVIPVYFPPESEGAFAKALLGGTVSACAREAADPQDICLSADGPGLSATVAAKVAREYGVRLVSLTENRGKLAALRAGAAALLAVQRLQYIITVDQDGDHFANELVNFVRAAQHVQHCTGAERVLVIGRRLSRHRPMGFLRGELEELADRVLLDALAYDAAVCGRPLRLEFATTLDEFPDFHSGYKLFSRACAADVFLPEPRLCGLPADAACRHAVEAVLCVEAVKAGTVLASVNRSTWNEQPFSAFGRLDRRRMVADKILWPCKRLNVPPAFVAQWLANHVPRLLLGTLSPEGKEELRGVCRLVEEGLSLPASRASESDFPTRPAFI